MKNFINNFSKFQRLNEQEESIDTYYDEERLDTGSYSGDPMEVYVLVFNIDISGTDSSSPQFIKVSRSKEELESLMNEYNARISEEYDEEYMEWDGISVSDEPYYSVEKYVI
jgi:hypothetical protein